ncbi:snRNA-activating protein complex subunit [Ziziphus jujuba]|uniref:snRNA-activating protein complex subunit n=2 Tax=Ziziphus jujuba TaxID=326968 RepID=A0A6P4A4L2_ZIZJJ|nr:snRNA-activating protein complex subunit [Ziziphus jujuba]XP_015880656.1 snRNA-activating protein complex subunit [Ziziphus jujuba]XP_015880657.1 snRNA-activating protein complex subunit [Ziziphus jujuba]XP_048327823.1 snRNA-activating protein complex subunit [Ziziphus jujuba]KAH7533644.1 hypothetical protein FEM48_Zijuj04G0153500 [Ziziphus jujuba var. spinosa]
MAEGLREDMTEPDGSGENQPSNNNGELLSIPRGGPLYVANLVGSITSIPHFEASLLLELQNLEVELSSDSTQVCEEDLTVDELKIYTEEELVDMAMKEAFKEEDEDNNTSAVPEEPANEGRNDDHGASNDKDACRENSARGRDLAEINCNGSPSKNKSKKRKRRMVHDPTVKEGKDTNNPSALSKEPSNEGRKDDHRISKDKYASSETSGKGRNDSAEIGCNVDTRKKNLKKGKKRTAHGHTIEIKYIEKVEELAKIKKKQDEDKAAVRLHSFNPSCRTVACAIPPSEKIERMKPLRSANAVTKVKLSSSKEHIAVKYPEFALSIEVYHNIRKWVKTQEFLVLGRQNLTELRDKIYCLTDQVMQKAGQHDPSGYFLIEDVFCNDLRNPSAVDYSEPIFDWLRNNKEEALKKWEFITTGELQQKQKAIMGDVTPLQLPHFKAASMHQTRFCDLKFRLGAGYLYCHQGDCKHTIVFRDMRLIHPEDVQNQAAYPIVLFQLKPRVQKCSTCKIYRATKVTVDDKWAQDNPCYFCDNCYYLLHYKDGSLLYSDFCVYDYVHD